MFSLEHNSEKVDLAKWVLGFRVEDLRFSLEHTLENVGPEHRASRGRRQDPHAFSSKAAEPR